ncbi:MAG: cold shock domain-containing protein [Actinomycetota bacterium]
MNGKMLWFNAEKGHGFIRTAEDERLYVAASGFAEGNEPPARCMGRDVAFERMDGGEQPQAVDVRFVVVPEPRRARLRRSR